MPRFLTAGAGSIWVLNQGDGTIPRVDASTGKRTALIAVGVPGYGGEITFGEAAVWASVMHYPMTRIDSATNTVTGQWNGVGGDSIRVAHGSVWLTNLTGARCGACPFPDSEVSIAEPRMVSVGKESPWFSSVKAFPVFQGCTVEPVLMANAYMSIRSLERRPRRSDRVPPGLSAFRL